MDNASGMEQREDARPAPDVGVPAGGRGEDEVTRLERALREVIELSEGGAPAAQRLAQVRRRASAALASLDRRTV